jgi:hypothetical protein
MYPFEEKKYADPSSLQYETCDYSKTHIHPFYGGTHTVRLIRDRMGMRSWGFTVERHDFGGACLVQSVELLSPAEAAMIVGCPEEHYSYKSNLRVNDMILSINGKSGRKNCFFSACGVMCCVMKRF